MVPIGDKDAFWHIYEELLAAIKAALDSYPDTHRLFVRPKVYSHERGSRGHRPKDLWVSVCADGADVFGYMPQVYAIASERGLEVGFAVSIPEDDYFNRDVKERNRSIVPFINSKLPGIGDPLASTLDHNLAVQGGWHFNDRTRLMPGQQGWNAFGSLSELLGHLKLAGEETGGGAVCRRFGTEDLRGVDLEAEFLQALENFAPLLAKCAPTPWDIQVRHGQEAVDEAPEVEFSPADEEDGRRKVWAEVARRQGQSVFRKKLLEAYDGVCAITGTDVTDALQAAHIRPYNGPHTNHVTNGLLLRADLHNLFDLKLITINPNSMLVVVSPRLKSTVYWDLDGQPLRTPVKTAHHPSSVALADHFKASFGQM